MGRSWTRSGHCRLKAHEPLDDHERETLQLRVQCVRRSDAMLFSSRLQVLCRRDLEPWARPAPAARSATCRHCQ